jgi:hypothetical protein
MQRGRRERLTGNGGFVDQFANSFYYSTIKEIYLCVFIICLLGEKWKKQKNGRCQ